MLQISLYYKGKRKHAGAHASLTKLPNIYSAKDVYMLHVPNFPIVKVSLYTVYCMHR